MAKERVIVQGIMKFANGKMPIKEFYQWFIVETWSVGNKNALGKLIHSIMLELWHYTDKLITLRELRRFVNDALSKFDLAKGKSQGNIR